MPNRRARLRRRIYQRVPQWMRKHDFELFAALLCMSAGFPLLITNEVDAASINATLPPVLVKAWSLILACAPVAIGLGLWRASQLPFAKATFWMRLEAWGLRALAYAAYIYSLAIFAVNHFSALPALMIVISFALTCHSRATDVSVKIDSYLLAIGSGHVPE